MKGSAPAIAAGGMVIRPGEQFVVFTQNHDQVANAFSESRSSKCVLWSKKSWPPPFCSVPLSFPTVHGAAGFYYFTDHTDPALAEAVREDRMKRIVAFLADGEFADPQDATTFDRCKLNWSIHEEAPHSGVLAWYRDLIAIRKEHASLGNCRKDLVRTECNARGRRLIIERRDPSNSRALLVCNFSEAAHGDPGGCVPARAMVTAALKRRRTLRATCRGTGGAHFRQRADPSRAGRKQRGPLRIGMRVHSGTKD